MKTANGMRTCVPKLIYIYTELGNGVGKINRSLSIWPFT